MVIGVIICVVIGVIINEARGRVIIELMTITLKFKLINYFVHRQFKNKP